MNELLKDMLYDLVVDVVSNGMVFIEDREIVKIAYENNKLLQLDDFVSIMNSSNIKRFLNIELRYEEHEGGSHSIKWFLKQLCNNNGLKFDNAMMMKMFRITKEIVNEVLELNMEIDEKELIQLGAEYKIRCKNTMQYYLFIERCLVDWTRENEQL